MEVVVVPKEEEAVEETFQLVERGGVELDQEAVLSGDPVALGRFNGVMTAPP
jgi:hypothetical protein